MGGCRVEHLGSRVPADSGHLFLSDLGGGGEVEERIVNERVLGINHRLSRSSLVRFSSVELYYSY